MSETYDGPGNVSVTSYFGGHDVGKCVQITAPGLRGEGDRHVQLKREHAPALIANLALALERPELAEAMTFALAEDRRERKWTRDHRDPLCVTFDGATSRVILAGDPFGPPIPHDLAPVIVAWLRDTFAMRLEIVGSNGTTERGLLARRDHE